MEERKKLPLSEPPLRAKNNKKKNEKKRCSSTIFLGVKNFTFFNLKSMSSTCNKRICEKNDHNLTTFL
jgi:hypothetical protein